jgi:membrane protease subunit HflC
MSARHIAAALVVVIIIWAAVSCTYTVGQHQQAILFKFGHIERVGMSPGLHFKLPFVENARTFDARIQNLNSAPQQFLTKNKRNVTVDYFATWRINKVKRFYNATGGHAAVAENRLESIIQDGLRGQLASRTIKQAVSTERSAIMKALTAEVSKKVKDLGIKVINVRIKRIEFPRS